MPTDKSPEEILDLVENEWIRRLSKNKCPECGRGDEAHELGATALSQMAIGLRRALIAESKLEEGVQEKAEVNPFALLATAQKLPIGHPTRKEIARRLTGIATELLQEASKLDQSGMVNFER